MPACLISLVSLVIALLFEVNGFSFFVITEPPSFNIMGFRALAIGVSLPIAFYITI